MAQLKIENLSFSYPLSDTKAVDNVSFTVNSGEFILICGKSGSGKTTLLRCLKPEIAPNGKTDGKIFLNSKDIKELSHRETSEKIGFVMQNPENQIVTDKVWHEIAFGLENLGISTEEIRLRTAETASYFGIERWFNKNTHELSGGQKQMLNLASVMAMHPEILILDEPTSQLDPISAEKFIHTVKKINEEFGTTVILTEHRLEEVFPVADRIIIMENGRIISDETPQTTGRNINSLPAFIKKSSPAAVRISSAVRYGGECPLTVRDGRRWLMNQNTEKEPPAKEAKKQNDSVIKLTDICFRYDKKENNILNNLSLKIPRESIFALMGGNGAGKTTLGRIIAGIEKPYSGKIRTDKNLRVSLMPQDVQALFTGKTVREDLTLIEKNEAKILSIAEKTEITELLSKHPFDLSGGEMQRAALAKVLLTDPDVIILDEPTKGMDSEYKENLAKMLSELKSQKKTVILISHDIEFCASNADFCALIFDGEISSVNEAKAFFNGNHFYTTAANRISRGIIKDAVTDEDVIICLNKE